MKKYILYFLTLINTIICYSQSGIPKPPLTENIQSPNAGSLGKYGDIPVSLFTGTPDVNIPIYEVNESGIPLNIGLNYDASGVRVNNVPGWVGQNWSLQAGGVITRSMKGRSTDEYDLTRGITSFIKYPCIELSWYHPSNCQNNAIFNQGFKNKTYELSPLDWASTTRLNNIREQSIFDAYNAGFFSTTPTWYTKVKNYQPDLEPDIFTFNFMGHTGKFFLGQDGEWKVSSSSNLKIICQFPEDLATPMVTPATAFEPMMIYPRVINKITIIDENGNKFCFGDGGCKELTWPDFYDQKINPPISSAWYLQAVYDKFGNQIYKFEYETGPYIGHFYLNWSQRNLEFEGLTLNDSNAPSYNTWSNTWDSSSIKAPGQLILPIYLKKIITKSGLTVELNSSISNAMKFANNDNPLIQPNTFNGGNLKMYWDYDWDYFIRRYSDFVTINPEIGLLNILKWKKLDAILIKDKAGSSIINVNLSYNNIPTERLFLNEVVFNSDKTYNLEYYNKNLLPNFLSNAIDHLGYYNGHPFSFTPSSTAFTFWRNFYLQRASNAEYVKYGSLKKITYPTKGYTEFEFEPHNYSKEIDKLGNLITSSTQNNIIGGLRIKKIINNDGNGNNYVKEYQYTNSINSLVSSGNLLFKPTYIAENIYLPHGTANKPLFQEYTMSEVNINPMIPLTNLMGNTIEYATVIEKSSFFNNSGLAVNINGYALNKYSNYSQYPDYPPVNSLVPDYNFNLPRTDRGFERGKLLEQSFYDQSYNLKNRKTFQYQTDDYLKVNAIRMNIFDILCNNCQAAANENIMSAYQLFYSDKYLTEEKDETFYQSGTVVNIKKISYKKYPDQLGSITNFGDIFVNKDFTQTEYGGILKTFKYPFDYSSTISANMYANRILPSVYEKEEKIVGNIDIPISSDILYEQKVDYIDITNGYGDLVQVPESILRKKGSNNFETKFKYVNYDFNGNLMEYKTENGATTSIIWGYSFTKPVARLENISYSSIPLNLINSMQSISSSTTSTEAQILESLNALRNSVDSTMQNTFITTYTYNSFGVSTITDPKGLKTTYEYDAFNRLKWVKDQDGNVLQKYCYNYKGQQVNCEEVVYKNVAKSGTFTRDNCGAGFTGSPVTYTVAAGVYSSAVSQAEADNRAQTDVDTNGLNYANANGGCSATVVYKNALASRIFKSQLCAPNETALPITYSVNAGTYTSTISQSDADSKALEDIRTKGQNYANDNGGCKPPKPGVQQ